MKKLDSARFMRNAYKAMRKKIMDEITKVLEEADDHKIQLDDHRGSLIYNTIDDQENEMILSIELIKYPGNAEPPCVVVWLGVYEEENTLGVEDLSIEQLLNVMEAVEKAVNDPE